MLAAWDNSESESETEEENEEANLCLMAKGNDEVLSKSFEYLQCYVISMISKYDKLKKNYHELK